MVIGVLSGMAPAAARYGYCSVASFGADKLFISGSVDFGEDRESYDGIVNGFSAAVNRPRNRIECEGHYARPHHAEEQRKRTIEAKSQFIVDTGWTGRYAAAASVEAPQSSGAFISVKDSGKSPKPVPMSPPSPSKYVEVDSPNGPIRLSREVAARNQAAEDDYRRKREEHARAMAEHDRKLALHQQSIATAAAERRAYEQKLALNAAQVAAHGSAMEQHKLAAKGAKGWMYCDARAAPGDKRRFYSRVTEISYVPGEVPIVDAVAKNRVAFKSYVAGSHSIFFSTESLLHCPYSTTSFADAEALMARDKRGDNSNQIAITQTGWVPTN
jgi:hypothetical protein